MPKLRYDSMALSIPLDVTSLIKNIFTLYLHAHEFIELNG